jgi:hypothetical protein
MRLVSLMTVIVVFAVALPVEAALVTAQIQADEGGTWLPLAVGTPSFGTTTRYVWQTVPSFLTENNFSFFQVDPGPPGWPAVPYGIITFTITQTGPAYMAVTTRFGGGGNSSGGWIPQLTSEAQLEAQGWNQVAGTTGLADVDVLSGLTDVQFLIFERDSLAGDTFTYRTEKYVPPILLETAITPEPSSLLMAAVSFLGLAAWGRCWRKRV